MTQKDEALKMEFEKIATKYKLNLEPSSIEEDCYASSTTNNYWWFFKDIKAALSEPETVALPDGWIGVKDRLPDELESVIIYGKFKGDVTKTISEGFYSKSEWSSVRNNYALIEVTHWMPLPSAPTLNEKG